MFLCLAIVHSVFGQSSNASLGGTVADSSGALIPGVTIKATNADTGVVTSTITNESGIYSFPSLQPGKAYTVRAELPGFQSKAYTDLSLGVTQQVRQNFTLTVSSVVSTVEVIAASDAALISSGNSVGDVLPEYKVRSLPLVGNNVLDLINTMVGYTGPTIENNSASAVTATLAGLPITSVNTTLDGLSVQDGRYNLGINSATRINPDLVGEIRLIVAPVDAETGRGSGQVQILTKSGTNKFTGGVVWNVQNTALNANTWANNRAGNTADWMNQQEFSANYSGPIIRNKTFFFALYSGQRMNSRVGVDTVVLTAEARLGNFRFFPGFINGNADASPAVCTNATPTSRSVDVLGNPNTVRECGSTAPLTTINVYGRDPNRMVQDRSGYVAKLLAKMPLPNRFNGPTNTVDGLNTAVYRWIRGGDTLIGGQQGLESDTNRDQSNIKIDQNFNTRHKATFNWTYEERRSTSSPNVWPDGYTADTTRKPQVLTTSLTSTLTSSLLNEFRFGWRRTDSISYYPWDDPNKKDEVLKWLPSSPTGYPLIGAPLNFASHIVTTTGGAANTNGNTTPLFSFGDSVSWAKGKHAYKGGVEIRISSSKGLNTLNGIPHVTGGAGAFPVQNMETANIPGLIGNNAGGNVTNAKNLLLTLSGSINTITQAFILNDANKTDKYLGYLDPDGYYKKREFHQKEFSAFIKDDWKILPSLTLNLGVRYDYFGVPWETHGMQAALVGGGLAAFGYTGRSFEDFWRFGPQKGELSVVEFVGKNSPHPDSQIYKDDWNNIGPAVGFSWQLPWFGEGRTTLRGGYGISYTGGGGAFDLDTAVGTMPGINNSETITPTVFTDLTTIVLPVPITNKPLLPVALNQRNQNIQVYDPSYVNPYIQNFNLALTRTASRNVTVDVRWVATRGTKLLGNLALNQVNYLTNGLFEALEITRAGGNAPLFDQMFKGLNISGAGTTPVGGTIGGVVQTGSMQLRNNPTFRTNIANGNYAGVASSLNTLNYVAAQNPGLPVVPSGISGSVLRYSGLFPENFIVNNPQFNGVQYNTNVGNSIYHSLQTSLTLRPTGGISYQGTYSFQKGLEGGSSGFLNVTDRSLNRGIQESSRKHDFRLNGTFELPFGPSKWILGNSSGVLARAIEKWQLSAILNLRSGAPLSITSTNTYIGGGRADVVGPIEFLKHGKAHMTSGLPSYYPAGTFAFPDDPQCATVTTLQATQASCSNNALAAAENGQMLVVNSRPGTLGNLGDGVIIGPGDFRFDLSASKAFRISESMTAQIRIDGQNVLNHPILGNPNLNINGTTFGQITTVTGSRKFQGQLRFTF
jgi:hypothetical protein